MNRDITPIFHHDIVYILVNRQLDKIISSHQKAKKESKFDMKLNTIVGPENF
jgi:hypothetical protein